MVAGAELELQDVAGLCDDGVGREGEGGAAYEDGNEAGRVGQGGSLEMVARH